MRTVAQSAVSWTESGLVPDGVIRGGIRRLNHRRLEQIAAHDPEASSASLNEFVKAMNRSEIAPLPQRANDQHYELPAEFFQQILGRHGKYSCCYWSKGAKDLDQAEEDALAITCDRARIKDGQRILDLGCGWGSLSLWIAERFPSSMVTAVSNSTAQKAWIDRLAGERKLANLIVLTEDMNQFEIPEKFDRIVSVEMFEHMRNYDELFGRIRRWLSPDGLFFMHIFCHYSCAYLFEDNGPSDWMSRHFFSGGMMPSADLPLRFQGQLRLVEKQHWSGREYQRTANAWLDRMDANRDSLMPWLESAYGRQKASLWFQRWRIFFMACAELFGHDHGREWLIGHYLFERNQTTKP